MQKVEILRKILRILRKIAKKMHAACFLGFYVKSLRFYVKSYIFDQFLFAIVFFLFKPWICFISLVLKPWEREFGRVGKFLGI